jgi:hypothetical protein
MSRPLHIGAPINNVLIIYTLIICLHIEAIMTLKTTKMTMILMIKTSRVLKAKVEEEVGVNLMLQVSKREGVDREKIDRVQKIHVKERKFTLNFWKKRFLFYSFLIEIAS